MASVVIFLTAGTTWTVPADWNSQNNSIEAIGAGGDGAIGASFGGDGGGGGAYAKIVNFVANPASVVTVQIGVRGGTTGSGTAPTANTWFKDAATLVAAGGVSPGTTGVAGGAGGTVANSVGSTLFAGGAGEIGFASRSGAGGGAAGLHGAGNAGSGGAGGSGDAGFGGVGGLLATAGGAGTEYDATHGSGGGGGATNVSGAAGPAGGAFGAAGGGGSTGGTGPGVGGLIVITYVPLTFLAAWLRELSVPSVHLVPRRLHAQLIGQVTVEVTPSVFVPWGAFIASPEPPAYLAPRRLHAQPIGRVTAEVPPFLFFPWNWFSPLHEPAAYLVPRRLHDQPKGYLHPVLFPLPPSFQDSLQLPAPVLPIPLYPDVPVADLVKFFNDVVNRINAAMIVQGLGVFNPSLGPVTNRQIRTAMVSLGGAAAYVGINSSITSLSKADPVRVEWDSASLLTLNGFVANYLINVLGYSAATVTIWWRTAVIFDP